MTCSLPVGSARPPTEQAYLNLRSGLKACRFSDKLAMALSPEKYSSTSAVAKSHKWHYSVQPGLKRSGYRLAVAPGARHDEESCLTSSAAYSVGQGRGRLVLAACCRRHGAVLPQPPGPAAVIAAAPRRTSR